MCVLSILSVYDKDDNMCVQYVCVYVMLCMRLRMYAQMCWISYACMSVTMCVVYVSTYVTYEKLSMERMIRNYLVCYKCMSCMYVCM